MCARLKEPFEYKKKDEFPAKLVEWIGDVLYDFLPEHGYEVRDEQIYTAFQIADAMTNKKVHLAEAGLGTGKTFAYLLSAMPYARFTGKPVVIACATSALQEQLASETGDIQTLSKLLGLEIDARMAKDPGQYVCDVRANDCVAEFGELSEEIQEWLKTTKLGERSEIPTVPDRMWKKISWDESLACDVCMNRGYCKLVKAREFYRASQDLIIVDHETFFKDLWTRKERIADGRMTILPEYSAVIFDEGHKILLPAAMQAGQQINREEMEQITDAFAEIQGAREAFLMAAVAVEDATTDFFERLDQALMPVGSSQRRSIEMNSGLLKSANLYRSALDQLLLEMQIEQELYYDAIPTSLMQAYESQIERATVALNRLIRNQSKDVIYWVDMRDGSFWVVPRNLNELLDQHLYQKNVPVIFTSATLSNEGNFDYFSRSLGLKNPSKSSIGSPFDIENQVTVHLPEANHKIKADASQSVEKLISLLRENEGRALVLTNSMSSVRKIRESLSGQEFPFEILYEDKGDRGYLVRTFREDETSVLIGTDFWEGIDVPGDALTMVIIWQLPFPSLDPLIEVQRKEAIEQGLDPKTTIDYPEMGLKLKQGCGRLIRTEEDKGSIVILDDVIGTPWEKEVMGALPEGASISHF